MSNKTLKSIGKQLDDIRWELKMNKTEFAEYLNISQPTLTRLITGKGTIKIEGYISIEKKLGIDLVNQVLEVLRA